MAATSPKGLTIGGGGSRKPQWTVGKQIGSGACASVHILQDSHSKATNFVVKIVPLPTKTTKKRTTIPERNARMLHYEAQVYQNLFPDYQGFVLPKLSPYIGPPAYGEADGFRFLVMEKMKGPLWDAIPALLQSGSANIAIGPIAEQLLTCVQVFHSEKHVLVDIKPENFMLAFSDHNRKTVKSSSKTKSASLSVAQDLAGKVRVLDLGLVASYRTPDGHRPDDGISEIVGTPLYASLNLHHSHTPSRRDDIEALGYVVAELIIRIVAFANGEAAAYEGDDGKVPSYLPWSQQQSDQAIGKVKEREVTNAKSEFYRRMGGKVIAQEMKAYFDTVRADNYKAEPNYDKLRKILSSLVVPVEVSKKKKEAAKTKSTAATGRSNTKRSTRSKRAASRTAEDDLDSDAGEESRPKVPKREPEEHEEAEFEDAAMDIDDDSEEDVFEDAMDWEPLKENRTKTRGGLGVNIVIKDGPHAGEHFELKRGEVETVIIGKNPRFSKTTQSEALWPLRDDEDVDETHARLDLRASRQLCSVKVSDLKSKSGSWVRSEKVKKGGNMQAFINDSFTIGQSRFAILELSKPNSQEKVAQKTKPTAKAAAKKAPLAEKSKDGSNDATANAVLKLVVVSGPHEGDTFSLVRNRAEIFNFGSARSVAKKGVPAVLSDASIEKRHARVQLQPSKKLPKVVITDLSESAGTLLNGKQIAKNKEVAAFINDRVAFGETVLEIRAG